MPTRNFVPRADGEGSIGTAAKNWLSGYFKQLNVADVTVDDSKKPTSNTTDLTTLLSNLANEIKQSKGTDDWKTAPATNLATLASLVGKLTSDSNVTWEDNKFTNSKFGITGLMEQNGYICFGKNFGGLILQWGSYSNTSRSWYHFTFPIAFSTMFEVIDGYSSPSTDKFFGYSQNITNTGFDMRIDRSETGRYIAMGIYSGEIMWRTVTLQAINSLSLSPICVSMCFFRRGHLLI